MSLFRKSKTGSPTVDAMLVLCVPEPGVSITPASGKPLKRMAKGALAKIDKSLELSDDAYVRFGLIQQDPTRGLAPGLASMMPMVPGVDPRKMQALMGFKPTSSVVDEVAEHQADDMQALLRERKLDPQDYELRSFRDTHERGVTFQWMAAVRKAAA